MDFGDILDQWETGHWENKKGQRKDKQGQNGHGTGKGSAKRPGAPENPPANSADRLLSRWLQTHEVYDKDAEDPEPRESPARNRERLLARRPDAVIDLHGFTREQAWDALDQFFETGRQRAYEKLAIIHGKGNHSPGGAVLKETVRKFIEHCPFAGQSGPTGTGITWVLLKYR